MIEEDRSRERIRQEAREYRLSPGATSFVGRDMELSQLQALINDPANRVITIVGPGGAGKTRLVLEMARRQREALGAGSSSRFPDGIFFVPLAALESADELGPALNQALGFQPSTQDEMGRSSKQQLLDYLSGKMLLLILDNFEQLLAGAQWLSDLAEAAPDIQILVTSRERLSTRSERLFALGGMRFPDRQTEQVPTDQLQKYSAVQLFIQCAQRVDHTFQLQPANLAEVRHICHLVNGLPLGIELAATWVDTISLAEIASEIERNLSFLETDAHDVDARHRSMEAVFDASWRRLSPDMQLLLAQLTVFRGGFTRQAADAVTQASLLQLNTLIKKSLLQFDREKYRYQMHRLLRQYGAAKLAADPAAEALARDRHSAYFCGLLEEWSRGLKGERQLEIMMALDLEITNARVAWEWSCRKGLVDQIDQALEGLCLYFDWRWMDSDLAEICRMAVESLVVIDTDDARRVLSKVLAWQGWFLPEEEAVELVRKSLALIEELESAGVDVRAEKAWALRRLAHETCWQDYEETAHILNQSVEIYRSLDDTWRTADVLGWLGANAIYWGRYQESRRYYQEKAALCRSISDRRGLAESLHVLGLNAVYVGAFEEGEVLARQSAALSEELGDLRGTVLAYDDLGFALWQRGRFSAAQEAYQESIAIRKSLGRPTGEQSAMVAFLLMQQGQIEAAKSLARAELQDPVNQAFRYHTAFIYWAMATICLQQGRHDEARNWTEKSIAIFEELSHVTVEACVWATLTMAEPTRTNARQTTKAALAAGSVLGQIMAIAALVLHLAKQKDVETAIELYSLISKYEMVGRSRWYDDLVRRPIQTLSEAVTTEAIAAAQARGQARELEPTLAELADRFKVAEEGEGITEYVAAPATNEHVLDPAARYIREELLGAGGQAEVYLGRDSQTGQEVAIKQLLSGAHVQDASSVERFLREAELLAQLEHPNIVKMLAFLEDDSRPTIIMEYVPGGSLRDLLNESPRLPLGRALAIALEVADALARAHHLQIVHRDLKPQNVLLAADGTPRLTDFGLARLIDRESRLTQTGTVLGTFAYLSPEVIQGEEPDTRADIWSFGVMLYEMLAGRLPFTGSQIATVLTAIISEAAPDLSGLRPDAPAELVRLVHQMLVKERQRRLGRMRQVAAELELIAEQS